MLKIDGVPISYISPQTVIDYYRDGGVKYPNNTVSEGIEVLPWTSEEQRAAFALLYATGARHGELLRLKVTDVDDDGDALRVRLVTEKNKRHPTREITVLRDVDTLYYDIVSDYLHRVSKIPNRKYLFESEFGSVRSLDWLEQLVKRKWYRILSPQLKKPYLARPHLFRHTRLTHLVKFFNFNAFELQRYAGWSSVQPAMYYVHIFTDDLADKMLRAAPKLPKATDER